METILSSHKRYWNTKPWCDLRRIWSKESKRDQAFLALLFSPHIRDLFWSKVNRSGECWLWTGPTSPFGYGKWTVLAKYVAAHRVAYFLHHGELNHDLKVLHTCDNPSCVNPYHLVQGTQADNVADMCNKGRQSGGGCRGTTHFNSRFTEEDVLAMRRIRYETGDSYKKIADRFNTHPTTVYQIVKRINWGWL